MPSTRLATILALLIEKGQLHHPPGAMCVVAAELLEMDGAGISLVSSDGLLTSMCNSDDVTQRLMDLELAMGEGPCADVLAQGEVVREDSLSAAHHSRWPAYATSAVQVGAQAVYAFPVRIGAIRLGVLALYRRQPGELSMQQEFDGRLMASVIGRAVLALQAGAGPESLASALEDESDFDFTVHQAAGIVSEQGAVSARVALVMLRAHAFAQDASLAALATRVVRHEIHFDAPSGDWLAGPAHSRGPGG